MDYLKAEDLKPAEKDVILARWSETAGREIGMRIRSLSRRERMQGSPGIDAKSEEYAMMPPERRREIDLHWEQWGNEVISRACVEPPLSPEDADRLDPMDRLTLLAEITELSQGLPPPLRPFLDGGAQDGRPDRADVREAAGRSPEA